MLPPPVPILTFRILIPPSLDLTFANGRHETVMTNFREADFAKAHLGKNIRLCYYGKDPQAEISRLVKADFVALAIDPPESPESEPAKRGVQI